MNILALDTATQLCSLALVKAGQLTAELSLTVKAGHSGSLLPAIDQLLTLGGLEAHELDLIACGLGPGSFTGIRVGLATAKGLAAGLNCRLAGVCTLDAVAAAACPSRLPVVSLIDARKGEVFWARYTGDGRRQTELDHCRPAELAELVAAPCLFTGNGLSIYGAELAASLGERFTSTPESLWQPRAAIIAELAAAQSERPLPHEIKPIYVRDSDAVQNLSTPPA
ncbi:MAG: tRNA threonylcarbamoyladenosine biosynthesis protein TsaB [Deltaproteobacteria bacterium ADurb.Bin510]|nr:MAG: tRNA threonylcarbamoyladenosine biosynthesis protein TsaB [Deltaproteobacteria bacterium ADurb.Bin510]